MDGRRQSSRLILQADVVVVGSGPAGAAAAAELAAGGAAVIICEEGDWCRTDAFPEDALTAFSRYWRGMGTTMMLGQPPVPFIQGVGVGGTSVTNGAICWSFAEHIYDQWIESDPGLAEQLHWDEIEAVDRTIWETFQIAPTASDVAGEKNLLMASGAEALELEHRPIARNVVECEGLGRCLQGCPKGHKLSVDRVLLPRFQADGGQVVSGVRVTRILVKNGRAYGIEGVAKGGGRVRVEADTVVVAASAVQTPALLLSSGIKQGPVGRHFQCHPGIAATGVFDRSVRNWEGATQGHEVIGMLSEGIKFEALGFGLALLATRIPGFGATFSRNLANMDRYLNWGAAIRAQGQGRVRSVRGKPVVTWRALESDVRAYRRGLATLARMFLAAGASAVQLGVHGWEHPVTSEQQIAQFEREASLDAKAYAAAATHLFGSCRMGTASDRAVVRSDFRHHFVDGLYIADSSVFPSNTGYNPQVSIMVMATLCARRILESR